MVEINNSTVMDITHLGHAGFIVEHAGTSILMDPWFYAANLGSIFPFPDNAFMQPTVLARKFDYLYISHAHTDHFDRRLLDQLDRNIVVICPNFRSRELEWLLEDMGFMSMIKLDHLETRALNDHISVTMLLDISAAEDSGLLIEADGARFLDLNDCQINASELPQADILACQFSGAIHFPQTYDMYSEAYKDERSDRAVETYVDLFHRKLSAIRPKYFIPSAGPFCFLHPSLQKYNPKPGKSTVFLEWERFYGRVSELLDPDQVLRLFPGDIAHVDADGTSRVEERYSALNPYPNDSITAYAERRADELEPFLAKKAPEVTTAELAAHWADIQRHNKRLLSFRDFSKCFTIEGYEQDGAFLERWTVSISGDGSSVGSEPPADTASTYTFKIPMLMLRKVIDGDTNWDEIVASHHMLLSRDPDIFDPQFFALLRYHHAPARARQFVLAAAQSNEMIPLEGDPSIRIQRFCPHAGEDLKGVKPCNGVLTCPRHRWEWDVLTGECLSGGNLPLRVEHADVRAN